MINVKRYTIDFAKLVVQRIPVEIRWDEVVAYVQKLVSPVVENYQKFLLFRDQVKYRLTITPQVVYLEKLLNDRYDSVQRRIYIEDGLSYDPLFIYRTSELKPIWLYRKSENEPNDLFTKGEVGQFTFDFIVFVPLDVVFDLNEITALIKGYCLASKFFKIQTF